MLVLRESVCSFELPYVISPKSDLLKEMILERFTMFNHSSPTSQQKGLITLVSNSSIPMNLKL